MNIKYWFFVQKKDWELQLDIRKVQKTYTKTEGLDIINSFQATWINKERDEKKRDYLKR